MFVFFIKNVILIYLWISLNRCAILRVHSLRSKNLKGIFIIKYSVSHRSQLIRPSTSNPCFIHNYGYGLLNNKDSVLNTSNGIKPLGLFEDYEENFQNREYNFPLYEKKWQKFWEDTKLFKTHDPNVLKNKKNFDLHNYIEESNYEKKKMDSGNRLFNSLKDTEYLTHQEDSFNNQSRKEDVQCLTSYVSSLDESKGSLKQTVYQGNNITCSVSPSEYNSLNVESNTNDDSQSLSNKPKYYILSMIPYPSGKGLHVGHLLGYTVVDVIARYKRFNNFNVLNPIGFDCFGIPTEIYSEKINKTPEQVTKENVSNFRNQLKNMGFSFDFTRELITCDPNYYKWTQWIFQQMFLKNLAYQDKDYVNYCPGLGSELSNEEIKDGKSIRGEFDVFKRQKTMWKLRITEYAKRLYDDLQYVDYPDRLVNLQKNWIRPRKGYLVKFLVYDPSNYIDYTDVYPNNNTTNNNTSNTTSNTSSNIEPNKLEVKSKKFERNRYKDEYFVDGKYLYGFVEDLGECGNIESLEVPVLLEDVMDYCSPDKREEIKLMLDESLKMSNVELCMEKNRRRIFSGMCAINPYNRGRMPIYVTNALININKDVNCRINALDTELGTENESNIITATSDTDTFSSSTNKFSSFISNLFGLVNQDSVVNKDKNNNNTTNNNTSNTTTNHNYYNNINDTGYIKTKLSTYDDESIEREINSLDTGSESMGRTTDWYREYLRFNIKDWVFSRNRGWGEPIPVSAKNREIKDDSSNTINSNYTYSNNTNNQNINTTDSNQNMNEDENVCVTFNTINRNNLGNTNNNNTSNTNSKDEYQGNLPTSNQNIESKTSNDKSEELLKELPLVLDRSITETMPQWAGSCWHYLRFVDPENSEEIFSKTLADYWLPVDLYVGGVEHAVSHLLYSRFWNKFLYDINVSPVNEPFKKILLHGVIKTVRYYITKSDYEKLDFQSRLHIVQYNRFLESKNNNNTTNTSNTTSNTSKDEGAINTSTGITYNKYIIDNSEYKMGEYSYCGPFRPDVDFDNMYGDEGCQLPDIFGEKEEVEVPPEIVMKYKNKYVITKNKEIELKIKMKKMSKSRGNVINPEEITKKYGSDALRLHLMFLGPVDKDKVWSVDSIQGVYRLLKSVNKFYNEFLRYSRYKNNNTNNNTTNNTSNTTSSTSKDEYVDNDIVIEVNRFIDNVTQNMENIKLNKISEFFDFLKMMQKWHQKRRLTFKVFDVFLIMFNPFAPHLTEHLWYLRYLHNRNLKGNSNGRGSSDHDLNSHDSKMEDEVDKDYRSISLESWPTKFNVT